MRRLLLALALLGFAQGVDAACFTTYYGSTAQATCTLVNLNSAASDNAIPIAYAKYIVRRVTLYEASTSLTTATVGVFTSTGGGGTTVVTTTGVAALTAATKYLDMTLALTTDYLTSSTLQVRNVTAQGGAATASVVIEVQAIP